MSELLCEVSGAVATVTLHPPGPRYELPVAIGLRRAREMSSTGNFVGARPAMEWGLVTHVVPHAELLGFAQQLAADAASSDPAAIRVIFSTYRQASLVTGAEARKVEARAHADWHAAGIDGDQVARRREAVIQRGRSQVGGPP